MIPPIYHIEDRTIDQAAHFSTILSFVSLIYSGSISHYLKGANQILYRTKAPSHQGRGLEVGIEHQRSRGQACSSSRRLRYVKCLISRLSPCKYFVYQIWAVNVWVTASPEGLHIIVAIITTLPPRTAGHSPSQPVMWEQEIYLALRAKCEPTSQSRPDLVLIIQSIL